MFSVAMTKEKIPFIQCILLNCKRERPYLASAIAAAERILGNSEGQTREEGPGSWCEARARPGAAEGGQILTHPPEPQLSPGDCIRGSTRQESPRPARTRLQAGRGASDGQA